jgi:hypothetical protein
MALVGLLVAAVVGIAVSSRPRRALLAVPALGALLVLFDINRLQPWFYQLMLLFVALGWVRWEDPESDRSDEAWAICGFVIAATYFWSGLQKLNLSFADRVFPWLLQPLGLERLAPLWFVAPLGEVAVAVLLVLPRTRVYGLVAAVAMHTSLLLALGPTGQGFNSVIWPWNLWMPALGAILFWRTSQPLFVAVLRPSMGKGIAIFAGVLPALNWVGFWDDDLSASLYSGKAREGFVFLTEQGAAQAPPEVRRYIERSHGRMALDIVRWSLEELNVPPYPELRVYRAVARAQPPGSRLVVTEPPRFWTRERTIKVIDDP